MRTVKVAVPAETEEGHRNGNKSAEPDKRRRERRPTYEPIAVHPIDPGWRPLGSWNPHPAIARVKEPSPVVASRPPPRIVGDPGPSHVGIFPCAVEIGA